MNEPTMETLARRLDRVERENRWLRQAGVVARVVIALVVILPAQVLAECAWVLWEKFEAVTQRPLHVAQSWSVLSAYESKADCEQALQRKIERSWPWRKDHPNYYRHEYADGYHGEVTRDADSIQERVWPKSGPSTSERTWTYRCFPETIDPREKEER